MFACADLMGTCTPTCYVKSQNCICPLLFYTCSSFLPIKKLSFFILCTSLHCINESMWETRAITLKFNSSPNSEIKFEPSFKLKLRWTNYWWKFPQTTVFNFYNTIHTQLRWHHSPRIYAFRILNDFFVQFVNL